MNHCPTLESLPKLIGQFVAEQGGNSEEIEKKAQIALRNNPSIFSVGAVIGLEGAYDFWAWEAKKRYSLLNN